MSAVDKAVTAQTCGRGSKTGLSSHWVCAKYRLFIQNKMDGLFTSSAIKNGGEKFSPDKELKS